MKRGTRDAVMCLVTVAAIALALKGWANAYLCSTDLRNSQCVVAYLKSGKVPTGCDDFGTRYER